MRAFRLERPVKMGDSTEMYGPFTACCHDKTLTRAFNVYTHHVRGSIKTPDEDGIKFHYGLVCGFTDYMQFTTWVPRFAMPVLEESGFQLNEYEIPDDKVRVGETQVCWHPDDATHVRSYSYDELAEVLEELFV